jgi:DoxX-like protein
VTKSLPQRAGVVNPVNARLIAYWTFMLAVAAENLGGAIWAALRIDYSRVTLQHLGYPLYVFNILGPGELLIAVALLLPGFPVAKQWAYAGATAKYAAALISWLSIGELHSQAGWALLCLVLGIASWALRPRADAASRIGEIRASSWLVTLALLVGLAIITLLTLPTPPQF